MSTALASNLERLRKKKGLTQEAVAEKVGVSRQTISNWEQGSASPDIDNLMALAKLYGVKVDDLLGGTDAQSDFKERREAFFGMDKPDDAPKKPVSRAASFPYPVIAVIAYFILGFGFDAWHPGWLVFLTIPIYYYIVSCINHKNDKGVLRTLELFPYPLIVVAAFLIIGFLTDIWSPTWILFLTIPLYYYIVSAIKKRGLGAHPLTYISFPVVVVIIFLLLGFLADAWAWAWLVFLAIPIWGWLVKNFSKDSHDSDEEPQD